MTGLAGKIVHECKWEVDCQFIYQEYRILSFAVHIKAYTWLSSIEEAVAAIQKELGDKRTDSSSGGVVVSVLTGTDYVEGHLNFGDMPSGPSYVREKHRMDLSNI